MKYVLHWMLLVCLTCFTSAGVAEKLSSDGQLSPSYGPTFEAKAIQPFNLIPCETTGTGLVIDVDEPLLARCAKVEMNIEGKAFAVGRRSKQLEATHININIKGPDFPAMTAIIPLANFPAYFVDAVYSGDLNGDGQLDFAIELSSHGNGLAAEKGGRLFILSTEKGYRYVSMKEVMRDSSLARLWGGKSATLILQRLVVAGNNGHAVRAEDGKLHTFFMFDLLEFDANAVKGIRLSNTADLRFPFFTLFTDKPSATATTFLDRYAKRMLWHNPVDAAVSGKMTSH
ncbi:MAG: hypothetical protein HXX19_12145 [Rhodoferax sp.]|nr:hypothetical protein [Rhodoferax sp.]